MSKIKSFLMELREYVETHPESLASKMILEEDRRRDQEFDQEFEQDQEFEIYIPRKTPHLYDVGTKAIKKNKNT